MKLYHEVIYHMSTTRGLTLSRNLGSKTIIFTMIYHNNYLFNENNQKTYRFKRNENIEIIGYSTEVIGLLTQIKII